MEFLLSLQDVFMIIGFLYVFVLVFDGIYDFIHDRIRNAKMR